MILCYVTDRKSLPEDASSGALAAAVERATQAGVDWVQLREKDLGGRDLLRLAEQVVAACRRYSSVRFLVNDRLDVAIAADADGVHLGRGSLPAEDVICWRRKREKPADSSWKFLVGVSCHSGEEVTAAERCGADYVFFGPVFETPSKLQFGLPLGLERLSRVCRNACIPVLAIGGIAAENAPACIEAGAAGVAAIRLFQTARDAAELEEIIVRLRRAA